MHRDKPLFDLKKIQSMVDAPTYKRAVQLYESGKIKSFEISFGSCSAIVMGTEPYKVSVDLHRFGYGDCECYIGQRGTLCKHIVAVSIHAVLGGKKIYNEDKEVYDVPKLSGKQSELTDDEIKSIKSEINAAMGMLKPFIGPSKKWFIYQNSLSEGCRILSRIISNLPVCGRSAVLLVDVLLRLDKKLEKVDDSDGTVSGFMISLVDVLLKYIEIDSNCIISLKRIDGKNTVFGWENPLLKHIKP